ncbi:3-oxoacyl-[acyl-carrier protein] reductase [Variovorax boronicumulans]|uniref:3-oxoacyl-[acyl-carrier protein] reductase n=1 Tax=Variovorax boronicumulans TaxID=436515 RepID=A0AAW8E1F1_9BURK|nr:SDR family NAD(P)-dependent oxidoreductase [Variovorax boronicumulans]MDP9880439.1 3-oxoacyl-[acyl-carrier protein] reductase [Variovorax boronicumulans]MDP9918680.1 3-oxoacyl-[acyl-carrier protein] reductase [Variovorax boronicumulans]MDP9925725.1 3-oxoacyl-[acyl-carrier protein] reductase [Variovorax boronicumulans]
MTDTLARPLEGRHAIVTGGARGIGLAIARRCLANGASVALWDVEAATLAEAEQQLAPLGTVITSLVDVRDEDQIAHAAAQSQERFGRVDVLVNNAGVLGPTVPAWEHTPAQWRHVLDINLTGAWLCCRALAPLMLAQRRGRIVNIASVAGKEGNGFNAAYSASKAGLIALTKSLGKELASSGVLVNCITPSAADTAVFAGVPAEHREQLRTTLLSRVPMGRFVDVDEVAAMAAWLASDECSFSTGAVFDISGGRSMY